jgi:hypothetical protein
MKHLFGHRKTAMIFLFIQTDFILLVNGFTVNDFYSAKPIVIAVLFCNIL